MAFEEIQIKLYEHYKKSRNHCVKEFEKLGTKIYTPTSAERESLAKVFGHQNPAYDEIKKQLLGPKGLSIFDDLHKVSKG